MQRQRFGQKCSNDREGQGQSASFPNKMHAWGANLLILIHISSKLLCAQADIKTPTQKDANNDSTISDR